MLSRPLSSLQLFSLKPPLFLVPSPPCLPLHPGPSLSCPLPDMTAQVQSHGWVDRRQIEPLVLLSSITPNLLFIKHIWGSIFFFLYHGLVKPVLVFPAKYHASGSKWCSFPLWAAPALRGLQAFHVNLKRFHFWGLTATLRGGLENC